MPIKKPLMNGFFIGSWGDKTIPGSIFAPIASPVRWRSGGKYSRKSSHLPVLVLRILHPADDLVTSASVFFKFGLAELNKL
jgi:hypothetical protein